MGANSKIEWTDASWNPIRARSLKTGKIGWHCEHATTGCEFCYAEGFNKRLGTGLPFKPGHRKDIEIFLDEEMLLQPLRWKKPRVIFPNSMTDLFADFVPDEWIDKIWAIMALTPHHTYQPLTKRADRMRNYLTDPMQRNRMELAAEKIKASEGKPWSPKHVLPRVLSNVWLGVSTERQQEADERIPMLLQTPAAVRFISAEPLLGPINIRNWLNEWGCSCGYGGARTLDHCPNCGWVGEGPTVEFEGGDAPGDCPECKEPLSDYYACPECEGTGQDGSEFGPNTTVLDWVIVGGESGPDARPMHPDWARSLRDQCDAADVAFFFKQWGVHVPDVRGRYRRVPKKVAGRLLDGFEYNGMPKMSA